MRKEAGGLPRPLGSRFRVRSPSLPATIQLNFRPFDGVYRRVAVPAPVAFKLKSIFSKILNGHGLFIQDDGSDYSKLEEGPLRPVLRVP